MAEDNFHELHLERPNELDSILLDATYALGQRVLDDAQKMAGLRGPHVICYAFMTTAAQVYVQSSLTKEQFMMASEHAWTEALKAEADRNKGKRLDG